MPMRMRTAGAREQRLRRSTAAQSSTKRCGSTNAAAMRHSTASTACASSRAARSVAPRQRSTRSSTADVSMRSITAEVAEIRQPDALCDIRRRHSCRYWDLAMRAAAHSLIDRHPTSARKLRAWRRSSPQAEALVAGRIRGARRSERRQALSTHRSTSTSASRTPTSRGSLAHARMLARAAASSPPHDLAAIERGLAQIAARDRAPATSSGSATLEDVHLNIERRLTALVGDAGKRLHTGRSRNDQVATDIRLWLRDAIDAHRRGLLSRCSARCSTLPSARRHHHAGLHASAGGAAGHVRPSPARLCRDVRARRRAPGRLPPARQPAAARARGARRHQLSDRPRARGARARLRGRLRELARRRVRSRLRDRVLRPRQRWSWCTCRASPRSSCCGSSPRFGFIDLADRFCTGSSIMPQKKNPDVPELVRGKTGRVIGHLMALLTLMKGQPLAYNKDNQEDKEPLFDTVDTLRRHAAHLRRAGRTASTPNADAHARRRAREGYATATDLADYLVRKGVPFRDAHEAVARAVREAERPASISPAAARDAAALFAAIDDDVQPVLTLEGSLAARDHSAAPRRRRCAQPPPREDAPALIGSHRQLSGRQETRRRRDLRSLPLRGPVQQPRRGGEGRLSGERCATRWAGACSASSSSPRPRSPASWCIRISARSSMPGWARTPATSSWSTCRRHPGALLRAGQPAADRPGRRRSVQVHAGAGLANRLGVAHRDIKPANSCLPPAPTDVRSPTSARR